MVFIWIWTSMNGPRCAYKYTQITSNWFLKRIQSDWLSTKQIGFQVWTHNSHMTSYRIIIIHYVCFPYPYVVGNKYAFEFMMTDDNWNPGAHMNYLHWI